MRFAGKSGVKNYSVAEKADTIQVPVIGIRQSCNQRRKDEPINAKPEAKRLSEKFFSFQI